MNLKPTLFSTSALLDLFPSFEIFRTFLPFRVRRSRWKRNGAEDAQGRVTVQPTNQSSVRTISNAPAGADTGFLNSDWTRHPRRGLHSGAQEKREASACVSFLLLEVKEFVCLDQKKSNSNKTNCHLRTTLQKLLSRKKMIRSTTFLSCDFGKKPKTFSNICQGIVSAGSHSER